MLYWHYDFMRHIMDFYPWARALAPSSIMITVHCNIEHISHGIELSHRVTSSWRCQAVDDVNRDMTSRGCGSLVVVICLFLSCSWQENHDYILVGHVLIGNHLLSTYEDYLWLLDVWRPWFREINSIFRSSDSGSRDDGEKSGMLKWAER